MAAEAEEVESNIRMIGNGISVRQRKKQDIRLGEEIDRATNDYMAGDVTALEFLKRVSYLSGCEGCQERCTGKVSDLCKSQKYI